MQNIVTQLVTCVVSFAPSARTLALRLKDARPTPLAEARKGTEAEEAVPRRSSQGRGGDGCHLESQHTLLKDVPSSVLAPSSKARSP